MLPTAELTDRLNNERNEKIASQTLGMNAACVLLTHRYRIIVKDVVHDNTLTNKDGLRRYIFYMYIYNSVNASIRY